jgi:hypothetical protein
MDNQQRFNRPSQQNREERHLGSCARACGPATMKDDKGNGWCDRCIGRYQFMQWAIANEFPAINFPPYAIFGDAELYWYNAILGRDDYIQSALEAMIEFDRMREEQNRAGQ